MSADKDFFESLLWTALYQLEKDKVKHLKLFGDFRLAMYLAVGERDKGHIDVEPETFNRLESLYKNVFLSSQEEECFFQNGRYENEFYNQSLIGAGTFGRVYKVTHKLDGHNYAVKKQIIDGIREIRIHNFSII